MESNPDPLLVLRRRSQHLVYGFETADERFARVLERDLSLWEDNGRGGKWVTFKGFLYDVDPKGRKVLRLPGGIPSNVLKSAFPMHEQRFAMQAWDQREVSVTFRSMEYPPKDGRQQRIVDFLLCQGQYAGRQELGSELIVAPTASGKTYGVLRAWAQWRNPLVAVFAQNTHLQNFLTDLRKFVDIDPERILIVDGTESLERAMRDPARWDVTLCIARTVSNNIEACYDHDTQVVQRGLRVPFLEFLKANGTGTIVVDEAHLETRALILMSLMANVHRMIYMTATPERTDWREKRLLKLQLPTDRALVIERDKRLSYIQVKYNSRPSEQDQKASVLQPRGYFNVNWFFGTYLMREGVYERWLAMIRHFIDREIAAGSTGIGIVLGGPLPMLARLHASLTEAYPDRTVGNFSSLIKKKGERLAELEKDIIVTTEKSFGASVNPPRMESMLLLAPISSSVGLEQVGGRLRGIGGRQCRLIDLAWDAGLVRLKDQAGDRRRILTKLAKEFSAEEYDFG